MTRGLRDGPACVVMLREYAACPDSRVMLHDMATPPETTLLILGAGGDLTHRLLLPGLASLLAVEPERAVRVVGADRVDLSPSDWKARVKDSFTAATPP